MTLCIAAFASDGRAIVTASDMRFDLGFTSGDGSPKLGRLNTFWSAMFAGDDIGNAPAVLSTIAGALAGVDDASRADVEKLFVDEYRAAQRQRVEALVLSPYGLTLDEFTRTGHKRLSADAFARLFTEIANVVVPFEFLVFGFDAERKGHLFRVHKGGLAEDCRAIGFWAIGSGDAAAVHHMFFHEYSISVRKRTAAYHVCAAKYFAERANLGERTHVTCLMNDGQMLRVDEQQIRALWQSEGRSRIPDDVWSRLPTFVDAEGKSSDDIRISPPTGQTMIAGEWISSAIRLSHLSTSGSGPDTPLALKTNAKKEEPPSQK
jgi:hypothetical protein